MVTIERNVRSSITKITARLTTVIRMTVLLPLSPISATIGRRTGDICLDSGGRRSALHDVLDSFD